MGEMLHAALGGHESRRTSCACANTIGGPLAIEGETDQTRPAPVTPAAAEGKRAIVESAAHP